MEYLLNTALLKARLQLKKSKFAGFRSKELAVGA